MEDVDFNFVERKSPKRGENKEDYQRIRNLKGENADFHSLLDYAVKDAREKLQGLRKRAFEMYEKGNLELLQKAKKNCESTLKESIKDEKIVYINLNCLNLIFEKRDKSKLQTST